MDFIKAINQIKSATHNLEQEKQNEIDKINEKYNKKIIDKMRNYILEKIK